MDEFKQVALEAVKKAEERILYYFSNLPPIEKKVDLTPVTKADKEAEEIIVNIIKKNFPDHGFQGEEFGISNENAEYVWIIDPIDGTKNFIHGLKFFGTIIGLKHEGRIVLGISNMPAIHELLFASTEESTTLNGKSVRVSGIDKIEESFVNFNPSNLVDDKFVESIRTIDQKVINMRGFGDTEGYNLVATGRADVMFEKGPKAWDISAYQIIIKQAGGKYSDFSGNELALGGTSLATNGLLHDEMLQILGGGN